MIQVLSKALLAFSACEYTWHFDGTSLVLLRCTLSWFQNALHHHCPFLVPAPLGSFATTMTVEYYVHLLHTSSEMGTNFETSECTHSCSSNV